MKNEIMCQIIKDGELFRRNNRGVVCFYSQFREVIDMLKEVGNGGRFETTVWADVGDLCDFIRIEDGYLITTRSFNHINRMCE